MSVLVDTSVWSLALRRQRSESAPDGMVLELRDLIGEGRARIIGPIRQELLSGLRDRSQYERLRAQLRAFPDLPLHTGDFERAAEIFNLCRQKGVQGSNTDFLLCAVAERYEIAILTLDGDFANFAQHVPIKLYVPRNVGGP